MQPAKRMRVVAWSQVWGAATGTYLSAQLLYAAFAANRPWAERGLLLAFLGFYTVSGAGAILLLRRRSLGRRLLILGQFPQLM
ncbi:MAG TPA: hypothetical protein VEL76_38675, partial [Gemmataceae bacterium]|nr:hypothetical protein [Gemmataceae bacterium]